MPPFLISKNKQLRIKLYPLVQSADEVSAIAAPIVASDATFSIRDINKFAIDKVLLIGELGGEQSEIVKTNHSTAPTATLVTLVTGTSTTSLTPSIASKVFTTQSGLAINIGDRLRASSDSNAAIYMEGVVTAYSSTSLTLLPDTIGTTTTKTDWTIRQVCRYSHPVGTKVYQINFDQVELSHATTVGGSKTTLTTSPLASGLVALEADEQEMVYEELEYTSGYYYARFRSSIPTATFGDYTDAIPYTGFDVGTVGTAVEYALSRSNVTSFTDKITPAWCYEEINDMFTYIQGKQKRWNKYQSLNAILGQTVRGVNLTSMPADIYDAYSNKSLTSVRIGEDKDLFYKDPKEFELLLFGMKRGAVTTQAVSGGTSLITDNGYDFDDTGSLTFFIAGVAYTITYTAITRSTGTFTGIPASGTGSITVTIPVGTVVYVNYQEGEPVYYTVRNQKIETWPIPSDLWDNKNIYGDYWKIATAVNSDTDLLDTDRYDLTKYWLTWKMRCVQKNEGKLDYEDGDYKMWADRLKDSIQFKGALMKNKMKPRVNGISYRGYGRTRRRSSNI